MRFHPKAIEESNGRSNSWNPTDNQFHSESLPFKALIINNPPFVVRTIQWTCYICYCRAIYRRMRATSACNCIVMCTNKLEWMHERDRIAKCWRIFIFLLLKQCLCSVRELWLPFKQQCRSKFGCVYQVCRLFHKMLAIKWALFMVFSVWNL